MSDKPHLGGAHVEGDPATIMPDVWGYLLVKYELKSILDVGAGGGHALKWFEEKGLCAIQGVDGFEEYIEKSQVKEHMMLHDFTTGPAPIARPFDLAWCAEFLEHVEERFMSNYMHTFRLARWVCVTHAEPGQGGHHHVNCQDDTYWIAKFAEFGFRHDMDETLKLRRTDQRRDYAYGRRTLMFFHRV